MSYDYLLVRGEADPEMDAMLGELAHTPEDNANDSCRFVERTARAKIVFRSGGFGNQASCMPMRGVAVASGRGNLREVIIV